MRFIRVQLFVRKELCRRIVDVRSNEQLKESYFFDLEKYKYKFVARNNLYIYADRLLTVQAKIHNIGKIF